MHFFGIPSKAVERGFFWYCEKKINKIPHDYEGYELMLVCTRHAICHPRFIKGALQPTHSRHLHSSVCYRRFEMTAHGKLCVALKKQVRLNSDKRDSTKREETCRRKGFCAFWLDSQEEIVIFSGIILYPGAILAVFRSSLSKFDSAWDLKLRKAPKTKKAAASSCLC
jgi:hypothetical protein